MLDNITEFETIGEENINYNITNFLPNLEPRPIGGLSSSVISGRAIELGKINSILEPLIENTLPVSIDHIEALSTEDQYPFVGKKLKDYLQVNDNFEYSTTFLSPIGPIVVIKLPQGQYVGSGYNFCFNATSENLPLVEKSLTSYYSDLPSLRYTVKHDKKNNTLRYNFTSGKYKYGIIIDYGEKVEELSQKQEDNSVIIINPVPEPTSTNVIPDTPPDQDSINEQQQDIDLRDKQDGITSFINSATSLLRLGNYNIEYDGNIIFEKGVMNGISRKLTFDSLAISFAGEENYPGIELFLGLLAAKFQYSIAIESMEAIAYKSEIKSMLKTHFEEKLGFPYVRNGISAIIFDTDEGSKIQLKSEQPNHGRGKMIWHITVSNEDFENTIKIIQKVSNGLIITKDLFEANIRTSHPKGFAYLINLRKC